MQKQEIIGYTTGVFDMFHIGHLNIIKNAKSVCDKLIVGVCSDELVITLKGRPPVIPYEERAEIVRSIKYVDEVVRQDKIDEIGDYNQLHFDVICKGDDWEGTDKWNNLEKEFNKLGVKVKFFPYTKHISSTKLKNKLAHIKSK